jgi:hypothetical protein
VDEAVRVLKNEIRKHTPLSVVLVADVDAVAQEISERGIVPDVQVQILGSEEVADPAASTPILRLSQRDGMVETSELLSRWLADRAWEERLLDVDSIAALRTLDVRLIAMLSPEDSARLQWLRRIPHYQRPSAEIGRVLWLTSSESQSVLRAI